MKLIIVALAFVAVVAAAPGAIESKPIEILRSSYDPTPEGGYNFIFETENGIKREETGEVKVAVDEENKPHPVVTVRGSYSYTDPNGKTETIEYFADENGYHAEGDSVPKAPTPSRR